MPLLLNLSPYDPRWIRLTRQALTAAAVTLTLLALSQALFAWQLRGRGGQEGSRVEEMTREVAQLEARLSQLRDGLTPEARKALVTRITFFNRLVEASVFSWSSLLYELESAIPGSVYLAEIQPDLNTRKVRLQGVAATLEGLTTFVQRLQERTAFRDVFLLHHAEKTDTSPRGVSGVEFQVSLVYRGTT